MQASRIQVRAGSFLAVLIASSPAFLWAQRVALQESPMESGVSFFVDSEPRGAFVEINGERLGLTPLSLSGYPPGSYAIELGKEGFNDWKINLNAVDRTRYAITVGLVPRRGYLRVQASPPEAEILIDGLKSAAGVHSLRVGKHLVSARLFGYQGREETVYVHELFPQFVDFSLSKADFSLSGCILSKRRFNSSAPGSLGSTAFSFSVSGPGSGSLKIRDPSGLTVAQREYDFESWAQSFIWDGRGPSGERLPDGDYAVSLDARGADGIEASETVTVRIDSSARIEPRILSSGVPGYALCPSVSVLPAGDGEIGAGASFPLASDYSSIALPFWAGFRVGLSDSFELFTSLHSSSGPGAGSGIAASGGLKFQFLKRGAGNGFDASAYLEGVGAIPGPLESVGIARGGSGIKLGLPLGLSAGAFDSCAVPELFLEFPSGARAASGIALCAAIGFQAPFGDIHLSANAQYRFGAGSLESPIRTALDARFVPDFAPCGFGLGAGLDIGMDGSLSPSLTASLSALF